MSETHNLTERIRPWVDAALDRFAPNEQVAWDTSLVPIPSGGVTLMVATWMSSAVLGEILSVGSTVADVLRLGTDEEAVTELVRTQLEQLRTLRSQALTAAVTPNGSGPQGSLIVGP